MILSALRPGSQATLAKADLGQKEEDVKKESRSDSRAINYYLGD
jgi:hypothetical protein